MSLLLQSALLCTTFQKLTSLSEGLCIRRLKFDYPFAFTYQRKSFALRGKEKSVQLAETVSASEVGREPPGNVVGVRH